MNDTVLVEFLLPGEDFPVWREKLASLGSEFEAIFSDNEWETDDDGERINEHVKISGKISSEYASMIKLQDPYLAKYMRISYISDELKNKYRK